MGCRHCDTGSTETQEHVEKCSGFTCEKKGSNMDTDAGKLIFWRRMAPKLKSMANDDSLKELKNTKEIGKKGNNHTDLC